MIRLRPYLPTLLLLVAPILGLAQEAPKPPSESDLEAERQGFEMLTSIAESIPTLRSSDNRIYLAAGVAEMLWPRDEKAARALFETLTKEFVNLMANLDPTDQRTINSLGAIQQQRREIIERMARRDPEMALAFLRTTRPPAGLSQRGHDYANEANLELHLAGMIADKNPEQALRMARATLKKGMSYSLATVLFQIAAQNPEAARTLHAEIVERIKSEDLTTNYDAANAAWTIVSSFQPPRANEDAYRSLVEIMANTALSMKPDIRSGNSLAQNFANQVPSLMGQFEKYAPGRVAALKQWSQQIKRTMDPGSKVYQEINDVTQKGTVEDLLALISKYPPENHLQIYQQAVYKAMSNGDVNRARQIINENIPDGMQRKQMLEQLDNQLFWSSISENKLAEARLALDRIKSPDQRFQLLIGLAANLINRGEKKQAMGLLVEAATVLDGLPTSSAKLSSQIQLAQCYSSVDSQQGEALMQSVILLANQLVAAAAVLDGFENSYLKEGEWMKRGYTNLGNLVNSIEQNLGTLARVDPDGARNLSGQLERPEIRLMAQLEIARSLLGKAGTRDANFSRIISNYPLKGR